MEKLSHIYKYSWVNEVGEFLNNNGCDFCMIRPVFTICLLKIKLEVYRLITVYWLFYYRAKIINIVMTLTETTIGAGQTQVKVKLCSGFVSC